MFQHLITIMWTLWGPEVGLKVHDVPLPPPPPSPPPVALVLVMQTCYEYRRLWHLTRAVFCEVLFSVLNTVTLFCICPCFVKDHIYFTIFVDKNYLILIVFFYLNKTIIQLISPPLPHTSHTLSVLIMSKSSVHRHKIMSWIISTCLIQTWFLFWSTWHVSVEGGKHEGFILFLENTWDSPLLHRGPSCLSS